MQPSKPAILSCLIALPFIVAVAASLNTGAPETHGDQRYEVFASGLGKIDGIVMAPDQSFYVSLETPGGRGQVIRIKDGERTVVLGDLRRADGLALMPGSLLITEEIERGRVLRLDLQSLERQLVARLSNPQDITRLADGSIVVAENSATDGRLVTVTMNGQVDMLVDGLSRPDGFAVGPDGTLYVAERENGRILSISPWGIRTVVKDLDSPDQLTIAPDGALWITENQEAGRVLRFLDGRLDTVLSDVNKPQGIAVDGDGWIYVAEQGRDRIIRLKHSS